MSRRLAASLLLIACAAFPVDAATRYDPHLRFRRISTPRFDILFHQGEERHARRLAAIAEQVASDLDRTLGPPSGRVHVILVDQHDLPNGWATPVPYNLIEITVATPAGDSIIGNTDDWLRLVFTHEYTHVVHLSRSAGWIGGLQKVFGRLPVLYPNLFTPLWQIEGIATFEETAQTGRGRVAAGDFRLIAETAALSNRFEPIDRASGGLDDWPSGTAPYVYGAYFHQFLAERYGTDSLRRLTDAMARRVPYFGSRAYRKVFGQALGDLWKDFAADVRAHARPTPSAARRLTHYGFTVAGPRFSPDGRLFYSVANPHAFPALLAVNPVDGAPREILRRYFGTHVAFAGPLIVFDQLELVRNVGVQSDLYARSARGDTWRLTRDERAAGADVSPDGRTIVCTVQRSDRRELSTLPMPAEGQTGRPVALVSEPDVEFDAPRFSPDGRWIAVERRRRRGPSEIVLIDPRDAVTRVVVATDDARNVAPIWTPDGARLIFASDRNGGPFRIFSVDVSGSDLRRLENTGASAESPALSTHGETLAFVGYTVDGYDLFSMPVKSAEWARVEADEPAPSGKNSKTAPSAPANADAPGVETPYRPWSTLMPRFWTPTIESDNEELAVGAATSSADALGRHAYAADFAWTFTRRRPDWDLAYAYDRWWPTLFVNASDDTDPFRSGELRSKELNAGVLLPFRRVRWTHNLLGAFHLSRDTLECGSCSPPLSARADRNALRGGWAFSSARAFGYSISREEGWTANLTTELTRKSLGADGNAGAATLDIRAYRRLWPRHGVVAARVAGATAWGDERVRREFSASGSGSQPGGFRFEFDAIGLLRGFDADAVTGRHAAVLNLDYRLPLLRLERGLGTLPFFARVVHGAVFADSGRVWEPSTGAAGTRISIGGELALDAVIGYTLPLTFAGGAAWRHDPSGRETGIVAFGRIGRAF
jgi:WD40-like Beta Propeller Repeat